MNDTRIESMKVFYDNHEKEFIKALVVTSDGKEKILENSKKIEKFIMNLKEQEGVETVSSLSPDVFQCAFKYKNDRINQTAVDWANKTIVSKSKVKLNRTSPYDGKETENIQKNKLSNTKKVAIAAGLTVLVAASIVGCNKYLNAKDNKQEVVVVEEEPKQVVKIKKEAPMSWEQYLEEYEDSFAKEFLQNSMSFVDSSIRTKKIGDEEVMYGIFI